MAISHRTTAAAQQKAVAKQVKYATHLCEIDLEMYALMAAGRQAGLSQSLSYWACIGAHATCKCAGDEHVKGQRGLRRQGRDLRQTTGRRGAISIVLAALPTAVSLRSRISTLRDRLKLGSGLPTVHCGS